jgi:hypothetical protein
MRIALLLLALGAPALAQPNTCGGLTSVTEAAQLIYPPIAKAARVEGIVVMLAEFKLSGEVDKVDIVSGPLMLQTAATGYVNSWRANAYTGPRTCPVVVRFRLRAPGAPALDSVVRDDLQHVTVTATPPHLMAEATNEVRQQHVTVTATPPDLQYLKEH